MTFVCAFSDSFSVKAQEWKAEFNRILINSGRVTRENYPYYYPNLGIGFQTEFNPQPMYFGISGEYHMIKKRFETFAIDAGFYVPIMANPDLDLFLGVIPASCNFNKYNDHRFSSAFLFKYRIFNLFFESKINFWEWAKGKDQPLKTNSYYSLSYRIVKGLTLGILYKPYLEDYHYIALSMGFVW